MKGLRRTLKIAGGVLATVVVVLAVTFGALQTAPGKVWLAARLGSWLSSPGERVTITGLSGVVPFDLRVARIDVADAQGPRLVVTDAAVAIAPADLLRGRLTLRHLEASDISVERSSSSPSSGGSDLRSLLHPPLPIALESLRVERLALGPSLLGEPVTLALSASGAVRDGRATADLDLHRIDGTPGQFALHLALDGDPLRLDLAGTIADPSGRLLAERLGRNSPLPVAIDLDGHGPLTDWQGRLSAKAGDAAHLDADLRVAGSAPYRLAAHGAANVGALLPPEWRPVLGQDLAFDVAAKIDTDAVTLDSVDLATPAANLALKGRLDRGDETASGEATLHAADLALLASLIGTKISGGAEAQLAFSSSPAGAKARLTLSGEQLAVAGHRVAQTQATIDFGAENDPLAPSTLIDIAGSGTLAGVVPASGPLPGDLGKELDWQLAARLDRAGEQVKVTELALRDGDISLVSHATAAAPKLSGDLHLDIADIRRLGTGSIHGGLALDSDFHGDTQGAATATVHGVLRQPQSGVAMLDGLFGPQLSLAAVLDRGADGAVSARDIEVSGESLALSADAQRAGDGGITAHYRLQLPRLAAIGLDYSGRAELTGEVSGTAEKLSGSAKLVGDALADSAMRLEHLEATADVYDLLAKPNGTIALKFRRGDIDGTASSDFALSPGELLRLTRLTLRANDTRVDGALAVRLPAGTIDGNLNASAADLKPWSAIIGTPIAGSADLKATLTAKGGQAVALSLTGADLAYGSVTAQRLLVTAKLADPLGKPRGVANALVEDIQHGATKLENLRLNAQADHAGTIVLTSEVRGKSFEKFQLALGATATVDRGQATLRVAGITGNIGRQAIALKKPLLVRQSGSDLAFSDLAIALGKGEITGDGAIKANDLSLHLLAHDLPLHNLAELAGENGFAGVLGFELTLSGTRTRPQGEFTLDGEELRFAAATRPDLPTFGIVADAVWRGDSVQLRGRLAAPNNAALGFTGEVPLLLDRTSFAPHLPPAGRIALHLEGDGEMGEFSDLLPIGEDHLSGHFTIDVSVAGTVAAPTAGGRLSVRNGSYESVAAGTTLTGITFDLVGDRDRLLLQNFAASDGAKGKATMSGGVELAAARGPAFDVRGQLQSFRAVQRDDATATASGDVQLTGDLAEPRLTAKLRIDSAELRVPESVPQSARPISVTVIDSATGQTLGTVSQSTATYALLAIALDVTVDIPGKVFVRGRGLDSEWRGRLTVTGTSAAPQLSGRLEVVRGTYDFIGKTAKLTRGTITFVGGTQIDPQLNMEAEIDSNDILALVRIGGTATQPTIALSSQPELPQDEILARVLFGTSIGQISAAQGVEIAQAAAALATGGGPGVLDRIRSGLGLDRLSLSSTSTQGLPGLSPGLGVPALSTTPGVPGSTPGTAVGTTAMVPGTTGSATGASGGVAGSSVSAGKYVASGVYVGVTQGLQAGSSSVDVQIDVTRHITLDTTAGSTGTGTGIGTGIGLNWKLDY